jgi:hypothetical protein
VCSSDAAVCGQCCCVGAGLAHTGLQADGRVGCALCSKRIRSREPHRPHAGGRAHDTCVRRLSRASAAPVTPKPRSKRPYSALKPTQQWQRRCKARVAVAEVLDTIGCPLEAITPHAPITPTKVLHLTPAERHRTRTVRGLHFPTERSMRKVNKRFAFTHATATGTFANGAYITDPIRLVSLLCVQSSFIAVGGDSGGGHCVLGMTYSFQRKQYFAALMVYAGNDKYDDLQRLTAPGLTPFTGESAALPHIFAVLQHLVDTRAAFLNGDWLFINAVLGLMSPSATHPCPICIISHNNFLRAARYRTPGDQLSVHPDHPALLHILPERIVPTPLHVFLGISNRIIFGAFHELFGESAVQQAVQRIKTVHSAGCSGLSDLYELNGQEITKWIKKECSSSVLASAASAAESSVSDATKATHSILAGWLKKLHHSLLHSKDWTPEEIDSWRGVVSDIHQHWQAETHSSAFPKLHMLLHSVDFAERHRFLGRASEAQIESYHATFNKLFHFNHRNQSSNTTERLRRSLAYTTTRAMQPMALAESAKTASIAQQS